MRELDYHEKFYYAHQTRGRGLTDKPKLEASFKLMAEKYDGLISGYIAGHENQPALDIGCGYGNFLYYLRKKGFSQAVGVDLDEAQLNLARSLGLNVSNGHAEDYLATAEPPGLIAALDLIEHLPKDDAVKLLELAHDKLLPGGLLIIQCPCADGFTGGHDVHNDLTHKWGASSNMLRMLLIAAGFERVKILDLSLANFPSTGRARLKRWVRMAARRAASPVFKLLGIEAPNIWSNSQMAVAWKAT